MFRYNTTAFEMIDARSYLIVIAYMLACTNDSNSSSNVRSIHVELKAARILSVTLLDRAARTSFAIRNHIQRACYHRINKWCTGCRAASGFEPTKPEFISLNPITPPLWLVPRGSTSSRDSSSLVDCMQTLLLFSETIVNACKCRLRRNSCYYTLRNWNVAGKLNYCRVSRFSNRLDYWKEIFDNN